MTVIFKIAGILALCFSATALGFYAAARAELCLKNLNLFISHITELRDRILYEGSEIYELIKRIFENSELITLKDEKILVNNCGIKADDKKTLEDFFQRLGSTERQGEINRAELCLTLLKESREKLVLETKEKSKLYRILGVCGGALVCILVI